MESKKPLDRMCKICWHPKRAHRYQDKPYAKCFNCFSLMMKHKFVLDNLKYLEESYEQSER